MLLLGGLQFRYQGYRRAPQETHRNVTPGGAHLIVRYIHFGLSVCMVEIQFAVYNNKLSDILVLCARMAAAEKKTVH